jgi:hypothetical protein
VEIIDGTQDCEKLMLLSADSVDSNGKLPRERFRSPSSVVNIRHLQQLAVPLYGVYRNDN